MPKRIAIIYNNRLNQDAIVHIRNGFYDIFGDLITIREYYADELPENQHISADAYILNDDGLLVTVRSHINYVNCLMIIERTLRREYLPRILEIPPNTDVLVVNDTPRSTMETISMLIRLGAHHLNLIPYAENMKSGFDLSHVRWAITPGEPDMVPYGINHLLDVGYRELSFDFLFRLSRLLSLDSDAIRARLLRYSETVAEPASMSRFGYLDRLVHAGIIEVLMDDPMMALAAFDAEGRVLFQNERARLHYSEDDLRALAGPPAENQLVRVGDALHLMNRYALQLDGLPAGSILSLKSEMDIRAAQSSFKNKNLEKGHVARYTFDDILTCEPNMQACIDIARRMALSDHTILIRGESGTGKELFAQSIHTGSARRSGPFLAINCSSLPESLLESELFGYEPGAFTGARKKGRAGLFEMADGGTLFLDEIGDISPKLQADLLRVLQEQQIMRIGSDRMININVRIIAATNRDLAAMIAAGSFRADLYYRLNVLSIQVPPLRERRADIPLLLEHFIGPDQPPLTDLQRQRLTACRWPGNVRELENLAAYYRMLGTLPPEYEAPQIEQGETAVGKEYAAGEGHTAGIRRMAPTGNSPDGSDTIGTAEGIAAGNPAAGGYIAGKGTGYPAPIGYFAGNGTGSPAAGGYLTGKGTGIPSAGGYIDPEAALLALLYDRNRRGSGLGRPEMLSHLRALGMTLSDARLRLLLKGMQEKGLITISRGRGGTSLTAEGYEKVQNLLNLHTV